MVLEAPVMVFSATLGARYIQWSLSGDIRTWGGLQCQLPHEGLYRLYGCYSMGSKWYYQGHWVVLVSHEGL